MEFHSFFAFYDDHMFLERKKPLTRVNSVARKNCPSGEYFVPNSGADPPTRFDNVATGKIRQKVMHNFEQARTTSFGMNCVFANFSVMPKPIRLAKFSKKIGTLKRNVHVDENSSV